MSIFKRLQEDSAKLRNGELVIVNGKVVVPEKIDGEFTMTQIRSMFNNVTTVCIETCNAYSAYEIRSGNILIVDLMVRKNPHQLIPDWKINVSNMNELAEFEKFRNENFLN